MRQSLALADREDSLDYLFDCCLIAVVPLAIAQGWLTVYWQIAVGGLGLAMFLVGFMEPTGKVAAPREPPQAQRAQQRNEAHLSKTL